MAVRQFELASPCGDLPDGHHHNVVPPQICLLKNVNQVPESAAVANRHQDAAFPGRDGSGGDLGTDVQVEHLKSAFLILVFPGVDFLGDGEDDKEQDRERNTVNRGDLFREEIADGDQEKHGGGQRQPNGPLPPADRKVAGNFVLLIVPAESQYQNPQRLQEEAPHHAERVRFPQ